MSSSTPQKPQGRPRKRRSLPPTPTSGTPTVFRQRSSELLSSSQPCTPKAAALPTSPHNETLQNTVPYASPSSEDDGGNQVANIKPIEKLPPLQQWRREQATEELSRRRILTWLQKRREDINIRFKNRVEQLCKSESNPSYLRFKKTLINEFGRYTFAENRNVLYLTAVLRAFLAVEAAESQVTNSEDDAKSNATSSDDDESSTGSSADSDDSSDEGAGKILLDESSLTLAQATVYPPCDAVVVCDDVTALMDHVKQLCSSTSTEQNGRPTYMRIKANLRDKFGAELVEQHKARVQQYLASLEGVDTGFNDIVLKDVDAQRLKVRTQVYLQLLRRLRSLKGVEDSIDEKSLLVDQLADLEREIEKIKSSATVPVDDEWNDIDDPYYLESESATITTIEELSDNMLQKILVYLPTRTLLVVIPKVCKRFRALLPQLNEVHLRFAWSRLSLTDRVVSKYIMPRLGSAIELDLSHCSRLTNLGCASFIPSCTQLKVLNLSYCAKIDDEGLQHFAQNCPKLERVNLYDCPVSGDGVGTLLRNCGELRALDVGRSGEEYDGLSQEDIQSISDAVSGNRGSRLSELRIQRAATSSDMLTTLLNRLSNLNSVHLGNSGLDDIGMAFLAAFSNLRCCQIPGNRAVSNNAVATLLQSCPQLNHIDVSGCTGLSDDAFVMGASNTNEFSITTLAMANCRITDRTLKVLASKTPLLKSLDVAYCDAITDEGFECVAKNCTSLEELDIRCCFLVTYLSMEYIGKGFTALKHLNIQGCAKVTDNAIVALAAGCRFLRSLHMGGCKLVTDAGLEVLLKGCPSLEQCDVDSCPKISEAMMQRIVNLQLP